MPHYTYKYLLIIMILASTEAYAEVQSFRSGQQQSVLVELYTSEGCNSCPPAERYLNGLTQHPNLWRQIIPVAFHVDYWDYLGWRDLYAHPQHGKRQSAYARLHKSRTVYTPAFVVNGKAWRRRWLGSNSLSSDAKYGELSVTVHAQQLKAEFEPLIPTSDALTLNIAVLGMNLANQITAGENEGRRARHEFVVIGYKSVESLDTKWVTNLPKLHYTAVETYALAVWVHRKDDMTPLQAVGGDLLYKPED